MNKLPALRQTVTIRFWSLRTGIGSFLGVINDIDTEVERQCYRVKNGDGWQWQIKALHTLGKYDGSVYVDQEILEDYGSTLDFKLMEPTL